MLNKYVWGCQLSSLQHLIVMTQIYNALIQLIYDIDIQNAPILIIAPQLHQPVYEVHQPIPRDGLNQVNLDLRIPYLIEVLGSKQRLHQLNKDGLLPQ